MKYKAIEIFATGAEVQSDNISEIAKTIKEWWRKSKHLIIEVYRNGFCIYEMNIGGCIDGEEDPEMDLLLNRFVNYVKEEEYLELAKSLIYVNS